MSGACVGMVRTGPLLAAVRSGCSDAETRSETQRIKVRARERRERERREREK